MITYTQLEAVLQFYVHLHPYPPLRDAAGIPLSLTRTCEAFTHRKHCELFAEKHHYLIIILNGTANVSRFEYPLSFYD